MFSLKPSVEEAVAAVRPAQLVYEEFRRQYGNTVWPLLPTLHTALMCTAAHQGHLDLLAYLLNLGVDPNKKNGYASPLPLHIAVYEKRSSLVTLLLGYNADVNIEASVTLKGTPKVMLGMEIPFLLDDITLFQTLGKHYQRGRTRHQRNFLHMATQYEAELCFQYILTTNMCDIYDTDAYGETAVMYAVHNQSSKFVERLLRQAADVTGVCRCHGGNVLHSAVRHSVHKVMGLTPSHLTSTLSMLLDAGADMNLQDNSGYSPLALLWLQAKTGGLLRADLSPPYPLTHHRQAVLQSMTLLLGKGAALSCTVQSAAERPVKTRLSSTSRATSTFQARTNMFVFTFLDTLFKLCQELGRTRFSANAIYNEERMLAYLNLVKSMLLVSLQHGLGHHPCGESRPSLIDFVLDIFQNIGRSFNKMSPQLSLNGHYWHECCLELVLDLVADVLNHGSPVNTVLLDELILSDVWQNLPLLQVCWQSLTQSGYLTLSSQARAVCTPSALSQESPCHKHRLRVIRSLDSPLSLSDLCRHTVFPVLSPAPVECVRHLPLPLTLQTSILCSGKRCLTVGLSDAVSYT